MNNFQRFMPKQLTVAPRLIEASGHMFTDMATKFVSLSVGQAIREQATTTPAVVTTDKTLMCSACYYLFDPHTLNPAWSVARDLSEDWRCPDCGASRDAVQQTTPAA